MSADYEYYDFLVECFRINFAPGQPLFMSESLRQMILVRFMQCPRWMGGCNICHNILKSVAGLLTRSSRPNNLVKYVYEGTSTLPYVMVENIVSYYMGENEELCHVLSLPQKDIHRCDNINDSIIREFFLLMSPDKKTLESLTDVKIVDPRTVSLRTYDNSIYKHFPISTQLVHDLNKTKELWTLADTVQLQAAKLAGVFSGVSDRKYEMVMLRYAVQLFFAKDPAARDEKMRALDFIPQLAENSDSLQSIMCTLNLMGFDVTRSTYGANSILYTLAIILVTTPVDESIRSSANDVPPLQRLITRLQKDAPNLSFHEARRVAMVVWKVWMRNKPEGNYMEWICPVCNHYNNNSVLEPDNTDITSCVNCKATQPNENGWSCRDSECKVRNYDFYNNSGVLITPLTCLNCNAPRGIAHGAWACPNCTLHNKVHVRNCELCRTAKPFG